MRVAMLASESAIKALMCFESHRWSFGVVSSLMQFQPMTAGKSASLNLKLPVAFKSAHSAVPLGPVMRRQ